MVRAPDLKSGGHGFKSRSHHLTGVVSRWTLVQLLGYACIDLYIANLSASRQLGFLSLLCSFEIFVSFSLSGMSVNKLGVAKCMTTINIHLTFF